MDQPTTYRLTQQINSFIKPQIIYGNLGETVTLIAPHEEIWIVEGGSGRFSVNKKYLTADTGEISAQPREVFVPQKAPVKKGSKKTITHTSTLF